MQTSFPKRPLIVEPTLALTKCFKKEPVGRYRELSQTSLSGLLCDLHMHIPAISYMTRAEKARVLSLEFLALAPRERVSFLLC